MYCIKLQTMTKDQADLQAVCPSRRRSCALVNTPSLCANKAVCHIQELKRQLENWCQQSGNVQHQMSHEKQQNSKTFRFHSRESKSSIMPTELYIEDIGLSARTERKADRQDAEEALQTEKKRRQQKMEETKLSLLHKRMHRAVVKYFRQRSLYSLAELARFQNLSNENNQKIKTIQEELSEAIQRISAFLQSVADDSTTVTVIMLRQ
ncbi:uncharacterized protein ACWYII_018926 [Salvelinus alpinus]